MGGDGVRQVTNAGDVTNCGFIGKFFGELKEQHCGQFPHLVHPEYCTVDDPAPCRIPVPKAIALVQLASQYGVSQLVGDLLSLLLDYHKHVPVMTRECVISIARSLRDMGKVGEPLLRRFHEEVAKDYDLFSAMVQQL